MITVEGPSGWPRDCGPPTFRVTADQGVFTAIELAATPAGLTAAGRHGAGFYGSWQDGPLQPAGQLTVPGEVWSQLRALPRLYYRALSSASPDSWVDFGVTVPDELVNSAPFVALVAVARSADVTPAQVEQVWSAALAAPAVAEVARMDGASAAVVRHTFGPRRPVSAAGSQWVVVVAARTGDTVREVTCRLRAPDATPEVSDVQAPQCDVDVLEVVRRWGGRLAEPVAAQPDRFTRRGPVEVWQDLAPPPAEDLGGTVMISASSGRLLFAATTSWQGGEVLTG